MKLLDWMKRRGGEPEDEPAHNPHETDTGRPIKQLWRSEWYSDDRGVREFRHHVGQSEYGFHGGLEVSNQGGEGPFEWGSSVETFERAQKMSYGMRDEWELELASCDGEYLKQGDKRNTRTPPSWER